MQLSNTRHSIVRIVAAGSIVTLAACGGSDTEVSSAPSTTTAPSLPATTASPVVTEAPAATEAPVATTPAPTTDAPVATEPPATTEVATPVTEPLPAPLTGEFVALDYQVSGAVTITPTPDGSAVVTFDPFSSESGPDLEVYLSTNPVGGGYGAFDDDIVDLGQLQSLDGSQQYVVPAGTDLSRYRSIVIWCNSADAPFGAAGLA